MKGKLSGSRGEAWIRNSSLPVERKEGNELLLHNVFGSKDFYLVGLKSRGMKSNSLPCNLEVNSISFHHFLALL